MVRNLPQARGEREKILALSNTALRSKNPWVNFALKEKKCFFEKKVGIVEKSFNNQCRRRKCLELSNTHFVKRTHL
jgi:hypothetical protein